MRPTQGVQVMTVILGGVAGRPAVRRIVRREPGSGRTALWLESSQTPSRIGPSDSRCPGSLRIKGRGGGERPPDCVPSPGSSPAIARGFPSLFGTLNQCHTRRKSPRAPLPLVPGTKQGPGPDQPEPTQGGVVSKSPALKKNLSRRCAPPSPKERGRSYSSSLSIGIQTGPLIGVQKEPPV